METRPLGDTGQESTVLTFGAIPLAQLEQEPANAMVELVHEHGVNHFDVAPTYGDAELKLGPKLREYREDVFLGCKTQQRGYEDAWYELERSLNRMGVEKIDLYQFHAVTQHEDIDQITAEDGALRAFREAKEEGLIDHIGLTSHGHPDVILNAIDRIGDLESVMFPMNYTLLAQDDDEHAYDRVVERCDAENLGKLGIKAFAKGPWPEESELRPDKHTYGTWYEPYDTQPEIDDCLNFALSQGMTSITNAGDAKLVAMILDAARRFEELGEAEQAALIEDGAPRSSPVPTTPDSDD